ncbi:MAG: methyltransferase domain-containing protein [Aestuariivirga sp.]|nr:methyltransferase domain-containing protein [Aestuariivirga sp.]
MTSWLHEQRVEAVHAVMRASGAQTVLDLGCGEGDLLVRLLAEPRIERIVGIDICPNALARLRNRLAALEFEPLIDVELIHGSMTDATPAMANFDCAVLLEVIEHVDPEQLSVLERAVFGIMQPAAVVITTPNADFNPLLGVPQRRFRHPDHRFEWGRAKFRRWTQGVADRNGYRVACSDVAGYHPVLGGASQMANFERSAAFDGGEYVRVSNH